MKLAARLAEGVMAACLALLCASAAVAQSGDPDTDGDGVPDPVDNCLLVANGPNELSNQIDTDQDGYGNRCDGDFNNDGVVDGLDVYFFESSYEAPGVTDHLGDGYTDGADFRIFVALFNKSPGPSGLTCAGTVPCPP